MVAEAMMVPADIAVVVLYFILVLVIGFLSMWKANQNTVRGYFLAGGSMNWVTVGASLFVSNIGSEHFIGLAGSGAASGLSVAAWELNALFLLQLLGWVFIPVYIHSGVYTMPEYLSKRYGGRRLKVYFAMLLLVLYIITKLSVNLYAGALFIQESLGWNLYLSVILLITMTALLTITGGLAAVIYTDTIQAVIMIFGALCLTVFSLIKIGGLKELGFKYMQAMPNITAIMMSSPNITYSESCYHHLKPKPDALKILHGPSDPDLPWPGFLLGQTPASIWYWCADQVIVQRVLSAKNISHAKASTIMAGFLKILPMLIIVIPGMIARVLLVDEVVCISPEHCKAVCNSPAGCSNVAYPRLVMTVMPVGLRGLMMAVMIAALMSDMDSIFNSASTIFSLDIYKMLRKQVSPRELVIVGRIFVVFMVIVSIAWIPVIIEMQGGQMFYYIQEISDYLTPPIAALFLLGVLWHRCNEKGAFWGGMVGFALGVLRMLLAFIYHEPHCDQPDERPSLIKDVHFMYTAAILFWVSVLVMVVVSLCTPAPEIELIQTTTLWGIHMTKKAKQQVNKICDGHLDTFGPFDQENICADHLSHVEKICDHCQSSTYAMTCPSQKTYQPVKIGDNTITDPKIEQKGHAGGREKVSSSGNTDAKGKSFMEEDELLGPLQDKSPGDQVTTALQEQTIFNQNQCEHPQSKIILNLGVITICLVGVFLFFYFSV